MFLSEEEIEKMTGYDRHQRKRICRFLENRGIPFETNRLGDPVVLRSSVENPKTTGTEPNLDWLKIA